MAADLTNYPLASGFGIVDDDRKPKKNTCNQVVFAYYFWQ
jgi:hypothetical protein